MIGAEIYLPALKTCTRIWSITEATTTRPSLLATHPHQREYAYLCEHRKRANICFRQTADNLMLFQQIAEIQSSCKKQEEFRSVAEQMIKNSVPAQDSLRSLKALASSGLFTKRLIWRKAHCALEKTPLDARGQHEIDPVHWTTHSSPNANTFISHMHTGLSIHSSLYIASEIMCSANDEKKPSQA